MVKLTPPQEKNYFQKAQPYSPNSRKGCYQNNASNLSRKLIKLVKLV